MKINTEPAVHSDIEIGSEQITSKGSEKERDSNHVTCDVNIIPHLSSFISENLDMSLPVPDVAGNNIVTVSVLAEHPTRPSVPPVTTRHSITTVTRPTIRTQRGTIPPIHVVTRSPTQTTLRHPIPTGTRPKIRFGTRLQMRFGTRPQIQPSTGPQIQSSIRPPVPTGIRPSITTVTRPPFITLPKPSTHVVSRPPILASTRPPIPTSNSFPIPINTIHPIPFNTRPPTPNPECPPPTMSTTMTPFSLLSPADKALLCRGDFKVPYKTRGSCGCDGCAMQPCGLCFYCLHKEAKQRCVYRSCAFRNKKVRGNKTKSSYKNNNSEDTIYPDRNIEPESTQDVTRDTRDYVSQILTSQTEELLESVSMTETVGNNRLGEYKIGEEMLCEDMFGERMSGEDIKLVKENLFGEDNFIGENNVLGDDIVGQNMFDEINDEEIDEPYVVTEQDAPVTCEEESSFPVVKMQFSCAKCGKLFSRKRYALAHCKSKEPWKCPTCSQEIVNDRNVKRHIQYCRKPKPEKVVDPEFTCERCDKTFSSKPNLMRHENKEHRGPQIRIFVCDVKTCPFRTAHKPQMQRHKTSSHSETLKIQCKKCTLEFVSPSGLKKHVLTQHRLDCAGCTDTFASEKQLKIHKIRCHETESTGKSENSHPPPQPPTEESNDVSVIEDIDV